MQSPYDPCFGERARGRGLQEICSGRGVYRMFSRSEAELTLRRADEGIGPYLIIGSGEGVGDCVGKAGWGGGMIGQEQGWLDEFKFHQEESARVYDSVNAGVDGWVDRS